MSYTPDEWVIVEVDSKQGKHQKVLGSWYGGYIGSDSYRFSSGIIKITDKGEYYEIKNVSGSFYKCYKKAEGMSAFTREIYEKYKKDLEDQELGTIKIIKKMINDKRLT